MPKPHAKTQDITQTLQNCYSYNAKLWKFIKNLKKGSNHLILAGGGAYNVGNCKNAGKTI